jgi:hypothetical protein
MRKKMPRGPDQRTARQKEDSSVTVRQQQTNNKSGNADNGSSANGKQRIVATYDYHDEAGKLLYQTVRYAPKDFRQRQPDGKGDWLWNLQGVRRVLYRLPQLRAAPHEQPVFVPEGEKDVDNLAKVGLLATTNACGAKSKWLPEYSESLRGRHVFIIPDNDDSGRDHAESVAQALCGIAAGITVLVLPGLPEKGDVSDWLEIKGNDKEALLKLAMSAPEWKPKDKAKASPIDTDLAAEPSWPDPLAPEAFHGLAGEIVRTLEPASEADPAGLLFQFLACFGNVVGRSAHFPVEADQHFTNEFVVLLGRTSKGRKGTSLGQIRKLFEEADSEWERDRVQSGLSSGEGLKWAVRDPIFKREAVKEKGLIVGHQDVEADPGISDKRLLIIESEFAQVLKQCDRQGNILSAVICLAWDTGDLQSMTKNDPVRATGAHVSLIGHCTCEEVRRYLSVTEMASGFGNRFLWVCVQRSKILPEGGCPDADALDGLKIRLVEAINFARRAERIGFDATARAVWHQIYEPLSEGKPGLAGALLARGEAHVVRLAVLYALLDRSDEIRSQHLIAALASWVYVEQSVLYVFGSALGDPLADDLLHLLRAAPDGMTRWDITEALGRHKSAERISRALALLAQHGLAHCTKEQTNGRPAERWHVGKPSRP